MHTESGGVNPSLSDVQTNDLVNREAPPPYTLAIAPNNNTSVVTSQPVVHETVIVQVPLKGNPVYYTCNNCRQRVYTRIKYVSSQKTHLLAGFICGCSTWCLMCCLGLIPYAVKTFKKAEHYCPNCNALIGTYSKI